MQAGQLFAERFQIERLAGRGGMGAVYRARDRRSGNPVALKLLTAVGSDHRARFLREAQVLAGLQHPGVVQHIAHGENAAGELFLAMEWLEGEDLSERLRQGGLATGDALRVVRSVAGVLEAAHGLGVIHRDIKPSNLFLVGGSVEHVKVLDFGIARLSTGGPQSTQTGAMLGTPGYMAPEQARGLRTIDGRADLFSLGCVLFECLTGFAPFAAEHPLAVLAKILLDDPPRLSAHRPDLGEALDGLLRALLAKDPSARPESAAVLLGRLDALGPLQPGAPVAARERPRDALAGGERRLFSVMFAGPSDDIAAEAVTRAASHPSGDLGLQQTAVSGGAAGHDTLPGLRHALLPFGGVVEPLGKASFVISLTGQGVATDQAERAARCALALRGLLPGTPLSLATGRGEASGSVPVGEVIDRAAALLRLAPPLDLAGRGRPAPIHIDGLTSALLGPGFEWLAAPDGGWLHGESQDAGAARKLLGRPTPCVGRERELSRLVALVEDAIDEPAARCVLVTGPPGMGKSRLRDELLRAIPARLPDLAIWVARGDPMRAGSPFVLLGQLVRAALLVNPVDPLAVRQRRVQDAVAARVPPGEVSRVGTFMAELVGAPLGDAADPLLHAAHADAQLMADQLRRAWEDWLGGELAHHPVLLILDDLHWGDVPTVRLVDAALRKHAAAPLAVLALGRPALHELFPQLWDGRGLEELQLRPLPTRAAEQLVRTALGSTLSGAQLSQLVEHAQGNPFFLEELIRAAAAGTPGGLPETVLAMVEARLESLDPLARRILRAASIFGRQFWKGGVVALCGGNAELAAVNHALEVLVDGEVIESLGEVRFAGQQAFQFRHALLQEAAAAMLTAEDRVLGHRLAANWLEEHLEPDPRLLAEHLLLGGEPLRAIEPLGRAAEAAVRANDLAAAVELAERAIQAGASGERRGRLRLLQAEANQWRGEQAQAVRAAEEAMALLPPGTEPWCQAALEAATGWSREARNAPVAALAQELLAQVASPVHAEALVVLAAQLAWPLLITGSGELGRKLLDAAQAIAVRLPTVPPRVRAALHYAGATRAQFEGRLQDWLEHERGSLAAHRALGDARRVCESQVYVGYALCCLGAFAEAVVDLEAARDAAVALGLTTPYATSLENLGPALAALGRLDEARALVSESIAVFSRLGNTRLQLAAQIYLAQIELKDGDVARAGVLIEPVVQGAASRPALLASALAVRAEVQLARGEVAAAREDARRAVELVERGDVEEAEAQIRLIDIETALATGELARARQALGRAVELIDRRSALISDPPLRAAYEALAEHRRTRALAAAYLHAQ
jgi:tetratricopeptide (TPR) repeat protein/predicted Ser/Thr protein kinase